jgi:TonB family protein
MILNRAVLLCAIAASSLTAQIAEATEEPVKFGPGVVVARAKTRVSPDYPETARRHQAHGPVIARLVITSKGLPSQIEVIRPAGYGLDEEAVRAIQKSTFFPATKDGVPVASSATVEISFGFAGATGDPEFDRRSSEFDLAIESLQHATSSADERAKEAAVRNVGKLADQKFPPALYLMGLWQLKGENVPLKEGAGLAKLQIAAKTDYGPAIYELALRELQKGKGEDAPEILDRIRKAAVLGSIQAQFRLGDRYEKGDHVSKELDSAKNFFRLCAARGIVQCQFRLATLLTSTRNPPEFDYEQAMAWFQLAANKGMAEAQRILGGEEAKWSTEQTREIAVLAKQFSGKVE